MDAPPFTLGIEEEYLLVDAETFALAEAPEAMIEACAEALGGQVAPEFLRCQIEVGTKVHATIPEAAEDLAELRRTVARIAAGHGLAPIAAACHPIADWTEQSHRDRDRYNALKRDLGAISQRMLIGGMHVHIGLGEDDDGDALRIDLMNQASYFLPHCLALSASSPFWQGRDTELASYRISIFDNLPRTGLPPRFGSWGEYRRTVDTIVATGIIEDATKIWWDLRPSDKFPTLEARICDVCPRMGDTLAIAAMLQCVMRMLWRLRRSNQRWRVYDAFLVEENRWRAQRYGIGEGLIDLGAGAVKPMAQLIEELIDLTAEDAQALGCVEAIGGLRGIVTGGNSSDRQRAALARRLEAGEDRTDAIRAGIGDLVAEFREGI